MLTGEQPDEDWLVNLRRLMALASPPLTHNTPTREKWAGLVAGVGAPPFSRTHTPRLLSGFLFFFLVPSANPHTNGFLWKSLECRRGEVTSQHQGRPSFFFSFM